MEVISGKMEYPNMEVIKDDIQNKYGYVLTLAKRGNSWLLSNINK